MAEENEGGNEQGKNDREKLDEALAPDKTMNTSAIADDNDTTSVNASEQQSITLPRVREQLGDEESEDGGENSELAALGSQTAITHDTMDGNDTDDASEESDHADGRDYGNTANVQYSSTAAAETEVQPTENQVQSENAEDVSERVNPAEIEQESSPWKGVLFRPSTAKLSVEDAAHEIEGFDYDFFEEENWLRTSATDTVATKDAFAEGIHTMERDDALPETSDEDIVSEALQEEQAELERVRAENQALQKHMATLLGVGRVQPSKMRTERGEKARVSGDTPDARYLQLLQRWHDVRERGDDKEVYMERQLDELKRDCEEREASAQKARQQLKELRHQVCSSAESSRTGAKVEMKKVHDKEEEEEEKFQEARRARLKSIRLRLRNSQLESQLKRKEEVGSGVHMIDYEQLKIENQSLNEKIEERNDELSSLKGKSQNTVQVLTHLKEKLQFTSKDNAARSKELRELDETLSQRRTTLQSLKQHCDRLKTEIQNVRNFSGVVTSPHLISDVEYQRGKKHELNQKIKQLEGKT